MSVGPVCKLAKVSLWRPIVVVLGATGVGKSKLALEVARKFSGEIVNADAMQVYQGLDVVTNKVSEKEQRLCQHHLLGCISPLKSSYNVTDYKTSALKIIDDIHDRGKLPVVVGGTNYYVESLLWDFVLTPNNTPTEEFKSKETNEEQCQYDDSDSSLSGDELYNQLVSVDPDRAQKIHPKDVRRVKRALQFYKQTGKPLTSIFEEQHGKDGDANSISGPLRYPNSCMIWVRCDQTILDERIDKRVDRMLASGLIDELSDFHKEYNCKRLLQTHRDYEHGIFQSIGFKEFHEYLMMDDEQRESTKGNELLKLGVFNMKLATRQYSRKQVKWIRNRFLRSRGTPSVPVYAVDSTGSSPWEEVVETPALEIVESFLNGSETKHDVLPVKESNNPQVYNHCKECDKVFVRLIGWQTHLSSRRHKKTVERNRRLNSLEGSIKMANTS